MNIFNNFGRLTSKKTLAGILITSAILIPAGMIAVKSVCKHVWKQKANKSLQENLNSNSDSSFPDDGSMYFSLRKEQVDKLREWQLTHKCKFRHPAHPEFRYVGAVGGADKYIFLPTTIGMISEVQCTCGAKIDLTGPEDFG